jgi:excinuclease ABC subunit A
LYDIKKKEYRDIEEILEAKSIQFTKNDYILIDRFKTKDYSKNEDDLHRVADSILTAFNETGGDVYLEIDEKLKHYCNRFEADGILFDTPVPNMFSENNPHGACPKCEGYGQTIGIDPELVIPNKKLSVYEGAVACWSGDKMSNYQKKFIAHSDKIDFPIHRPIHKLTVKEYDTLWNGAHGIQSFFTMVAQNLYKIQYRILQARYRGKTTCPDCEGKKLRQESLYVKINKTDIATLYSMPIENLKVWLDKLKLDQREQKIAKRLLIEINSRVDTLLTVGLNYLTLNRKANTLSGGESQRIQLTRIIGSNLTDSLYILDEPSIGLHARDTKQLISVLQKLKELGNTVVVVEHDELIMRDADHIIDVGPLASHLGGEIVAEGNYKKLIKNKKSLTAQYLNEDLIVNLKKAKRTIKHKLSLSDCSEHNLKNIDVDFPLNHLVVVTGVSGSGKTTLVKRILYPAIKNAKDQFELKPGAFDELTGDVHLIDAVEMVDQNPIGRSSRSNPVSYIKAYDDIRSLYAAQKIAKLRGYKTGHFSFNVDGGRCDTCKGDGNITVEMQFLADVKLLCESCSGKRFKDEVLEVKYNSKNIADVLDMSVDDALEFFSENSKILKKLQALADVGLGYIKLGQSSDTLSGGEAQRVKLASFLLLSNKANKMLFIFDEPTTGLHFHDIVKLLNSFEALIQNGHSVIVIEHNMDVIKNADWIIDLGPEGGEHGGSLLYSGEVKGLKKIKGSYTGEWL